MSWLRHCLAPDSVYETKQDNKGSQQVSLLTIIIAFPSYAKKEKKINYVLHQPLSVGHLMKSYGNPTFYNRCYHPHSTEDGTEDF